MQALAKKQQRVCKYGYYHGRYKDEVMAAFEETEEMVRKIRAGDRSGCMTIEEYFAEMRRWDEEEDVYN